MSEDMKNNDEVTEIVDETVTEVAPEKKGADKVPNNININVGDGYQITKQSNGLGTAGFVLALIGLFVSWIPYLGWIVWILGAIFSIIGLFRKPKGLAIAGTVISFIGFILLIAVVGTLIGAAGVGSMMQ